jgi:hypothetical protein
MVHKFDTLGVKCALDVCSGTVHILDDISYRMLDFLTKKVTLTLRRQKKKIVPMKSAWKLWLN